MQHRKTARKRAQIQKVPRHPRMAKRSPTLRPTRATARCRSAARSAPPAPHAHPRHRHRRTRRKREPSCSTSIRASLRHALNRSFALLATMRATSSPCCWSHRSHRPHTTRTRRTPSAASAHASALVDAAHAHHRRRTALVEQTLERLSHLFAHDDHLVAATCGQARPHKLRIAGIARLKRAGGAHRGARAAAHALRRVHHKPVVSRAMHPDVHASAHFRHATLRLRTLAQRSWRTRIATLSTSASTPTMLRLPMRR